MIVISKEEKDAVLERFPNASIQRTKKSKSKRHRYYCEERRSILSFLKKRKEENVIYRGRR